MLSGHRPCSIAFSLLSSSARYPPLIFTSEGANVTYTRGKRDALTSRAHPPPTPPPTAPFFSIPYFILFSLGRFPFLPKFPPPLPTNPASSLSLGQRLRADYLLVPLARSLRNQPPFPLGHLLSPPTLLSPGPSSAPRPAPPSRVQWPSPNRSFLACPSGHNSPGGRRRRARARISKPWHRVLHLAALLSSSEARLSTAQARTGSERER